MEQHTGLESADSRLVGTASGILIHAGLSDLGQGTLHVRRSSGQYSAASCRLRRLLHCLPDAEIPRFAGLYGTYEPMESEFYLALASLCQNDRNAALRHFENAQKLSPQDENIRKNIEILKRQRQ